MVVISHMDFAQAKESSSESELSVLQALEIELISEFTESPLESDDIQTINSVNAFEYTVQSHLYYIKFRGVEILEIEDRPTKEQLLWVKREVRSCSEHYKTVQIPKRDYNELLSKIERYYQFYNYWIVVIDAEGFISTAQTKLGRGFRFEVHYNNNYFDSTEFAQDVLYNHFKVYEAKIREEWLFSKVNLPVLPIERLEVRVAGDIVRLEELVRENESCFNVRYRRNAGGYVLPSSLRRGVSRRRGRCGEPETKRIRG